MKKLLSIAVLLVPMCTITAQNSLVYKAQEKINENKLDEAAAVMETALTSGKTKNMAGAYNMAGVCQGKILSAEIAKAAQQQPLDTMKFISALNKAVEYFEKSYKLDNAPDEKGKIKPKYNKDVEDPFQSNVKMISQMMNYYAYAGQFLNQNGDQKGAYDAFEKYLEMPKSSVFTKEQTDSIYKSNSAEYYTIAFYTTLLGYQLKDDDKALKHIDFALQDTAQKNKSDLYFIKAQTLLNKKDTAKWVKCVTEAITALPNNTQFVQNLLYYYSIKNLTEEAKSTAEEMIAKAPNNKNAWYSAGCIYLNMAKDFTKAREYLQKALDIDANFPDANYNLGVTYVNELISKKDQFVTDPRNAKYKTDVEKVKDYYRKALPYFEKTRELIPDQPQVWGLSLKNIYYNLEMKDKEKEIDQELSSAGIANPNQENKK
jgi:tetratricopeptide (TPR) repeat protein